MARSLLEGLEDSPSPGKKKKGGGKGDPKLFVAIGLLVLAFGILGYWYLLRGETVEPPVVDPAVVEEAQRHHEEIVRQAPPAGS
jgi:hypothetical protein